MFNLKSMLSVLLLLVASSAQAISYRAPLDNSVWRLEASIFECRLSHPIPQYGEAQFLRRAGEGLSFNLNSWHRPMKQGKASVAANAPAWRYDRSARELGQVRVAQGNQPLALSGALPTQLLAQLYQGMQPAFNRLAWYDSEAMVDVELSAVNFQGVYSEYVGCLSQLLPVNFDQIRRSFVLFEVGSSILREDALSKLSNIALYVNADPSVNGVFIDGHTDSRGRRLSNRELSKSRAEAVRSFLTNRGLPADIITLRFHGERYPVAKNNTSNNRSRNRRVTIRLEKEELFDS